MNGTAWAEEAACRYAIEHIPDADVAHVPDADVNYNTNYNAIGLPERVQIPLTIDMAQYIGINTPLGSELQAAIGMIEVDTKTNHLYFDGKDITDTVNTYCNKQEEETEEKKEDDVKTE